MTNQRCGSHMIKTALNGHPRLRLTGEAFGGKARYDIELGINPDCTTPEALHAVFTNFDGFILHRTHPVSALKQCQDLVGHLVANPQIYFLDLRRRNLLRRYLSYHVGKVTGSFDGICGEILPSMHIDQRDAEQDFKSVTNQYQEFHKPLPAERTMTLYYEEIDFDAICSFLGLERYDLRPSTIKRDERLLSQAISNFHDLKRTWQNTEWSVFFDD